ncbi:MAG: endonuclease/exonuclease/phosphatase family protein [Anaerolineae bacterium]|nr:endonuclease/exonuclease/phosphatase family protein [Anaerolineae bacterium]
MSAQNNGNTHSGGFKQVALAGWNLVLAGGLVYGLAMLCFLAARLTIGERWGPVAMANNFVPWWALGAGVFGVVSVFSRRRWLLVPVQAPIIIVFLVLYGDLLLPHKSAAGANGGRPLTVATYNILSRSSEPDRIIDMIVRMDADIVGLQELGPAHAEQIVAELSQQYPYQALEPHTSVYGVGLLSRFPIREYDVFRLASNNMRHMRAVLDVDGVPVTLYVAHPPPPRDAFSPLTYDAGGRDDVIDALRENYLLAETGPLLVVGDFNASDQSDVYHTLDVFLDDAFREAGQGMGFTFPDRPPGRVRIMSPLVRAPAVRIDYIWYSAHFVALEADVGKDGASSDHRPVIARLSLQE